MRYDAFISYRHAELDLYIAKKLHKGLETFKVPRAATGKSGKKNIKRVFRDQEELPIGSDLGDNIETALAQSEFLIVICSPRTPESYWVQKEIETFMKLHDREHVLAVLIEGEPAESFPAQILADDEGNPVEPLAADVRGKSRHEINKKLKSEIVRLAAPLLGCSYDDLRQRHRERKIKRVAAVLTAVTAGAVLFGIYSAYNAAMIKQNYEGKQRNQSKYLADTSLSLLEAGDRRAAVLVAQAALPGKDDDKPYVAEAQYALSQALYCYDTGQDMKVDRLLQHEQPVNDFWLSKDASMALAVDQESNVYVWDVPKGKKLLQIAPAVNEYGSLNEVKGAVVCEDKIVLCERDDLRAVSLDGTELWYVEAPEMISYCKLDEETMQAVCVGSSQVNFYDMTSGELLGSMVNNQETAYSSAMAFDKKHTRFAISHTASVEKGTGCVSIYDFKTRKITNVETIADYVSEIAFTADGQLAAVSMRSSDLSDYSWDSAEGYLEKIDCQSGEALWQSAYEYQIAGYEAAEAQLKTRSYIEAETGKSHDEVLMSIDNAVYTWDNADGGLIAQVRTDDGIVRFLAADNNGFAFLAESNGTVDIVDMTEGFRFSESAIHTNVNLRDMSIQNGVLAVSAYASPDIKIFKYHENDSKIELEKYPAGVKSVQYSPSETYYAVNAYDSDLKVSVFFYRTEDNALADKWINEEGRLVEECCFVDDAVYMAVCSDGSMYFYDIESGEQETLNLFSGDTDAEYFLDKRNSRVFLFDGRKYMTVDLKQRKVIAEGGAELIEDQGYQEVNSGSVKTAFAVSGDGALLAVCCQDNMLRVLNLENMETTAEIPFTGVRRRMIKFSEDCRQIMMQGDDYYFRAYDLEKKEFVHVSIDQYNEIKEVLTDGREGTITLITTADMIILNGEDYERIAQIDGGAAYLPEHARILCSYGGQMYQFPYMTLDMLREEAWVQFEGEKLTDLEKTRFHVE
ncbi:MAG: toll/interleukin-1 receptor domain-containing protein [Lachnospiraceae bacterium]|nr:toll/interleukin-1 receptor domain-containing protein [Lachnospiraceae bacterium]